MVLLPFDKSRGSAQTTGGVARKEYGGTLTVWAFPPKVAKTLGVNFADFGRWTNRDRQEFHRALASRDRPRARPRACGRDSPTARPDARRSSAPDLLDPGLVFDPDLYQAFREGVARLSPSVAAHHGSAASPSR